MNSVPRMMALIHNPLGTVNTLSLCLALRERIKEPDYTGRLDSPEVERRVQYWAHEVVKRVMLFAADPRGW